MQTMFRCPFEVKGMRDGTIIEEQLGEHKALRLLAIRAALKRLYGDTTRIAVRLILPRSAWQGASSNRELRPLILPYQAEYLAADMDLRLWPYLPYHRAYIARLRYWREKRYQRKGARIFSRTLRACAPMPKGVVGLSESLHDIFAWKMKRGNTNPTITLGDLKKDGERYWLFHMDPSAFAVYKDHKRLKDPVVNDVLFTIVKTPFYPKQFGRYSKDVEIVVTRDVDVMQLSQEEIAEIRSASNRVHIAHGVRIHDAWRDQIPTGLWLVEEDLDLFQT